MMTIKEFSGLCGCHAQTLRYYDKIGLLKPFMVDPWSGYRYYTKSQAIDFVKIKNLQAADFTIDEIKELLTMPDPQVYEAFDRKIAAQTQKLERIREIQRSYLTEKSNMERIVQNAADYILHAVSDYEVLREFGLSPDDGPSIVAQLKEYIERITRQHLPAESEVQLIVNDRVIRGADHIADTLAELKENGYDDTVLLGAEHIQEEEDFTPENSEVLWAHHGWKFVYEFMDRIPVMDTGSDYCFYFELTEEKYRMGIEFPAFMVAAMLSKEKADELKMGCSIQRSTDGLNHFILLRRK